jgi:dTDP-4-dehydrorhamnose 3,5-epimerase
MSRGRGDAAGTRLRSGEAIDGVVLRPLRANRDARGALTEIFADGWKLGITPVQWSLVQSQARTLRGMHLHWRHDEYFCLVQGRALVGLHDLRPDSPTYRAASLYELDAADLHGLAFPRGIVHGWYFVESALHLQAVSECYADYHPDDNQGCYFGDPALGLPWPDATPLLSERAAAFGPLGRLIPGPAPASRSAATASAPDA